MSAAQHDMPLADQIAAVEDAIEEHGRAMLRRAGYRGFSRLRAQLQERSLRAALATLKALREAEDGSTPQLLGHDG